MLARALAFLFMTALIVSLAGNAAAQEKVDPKKKPDTQNEFNLDRFVKKVGELKDPEDQIKLVLETMQKLNPGFREFAATKIVDGEVTYVALDTSKYVSDIRPLRAFSKLTYLHAVGVTYMAGKVSDISSLKGLKLEKLEIQGNPEIADLTVLKGMPLTTLDCSYTKVASLAPLEECKTLEILNCNFTRVTDLKPITRLALSQLACSGNKGTGGGTITDVTPLKGMKLKRLDCALNGVRDFSVIGGMPLEYLNISETKIANFDCLKTLPLTELYIAHTDFNEKHGLLLKGKAITVLQVQYTKINDLQFAQGMPLVTLYCDTCPFLKDLQGLQNSNLKTIHCERTPIKDLKPLAGLPLVGVYCEDTNVTSLEPLKDAPLDELYCGRSPKTAISKLNDLTPLAGTKLRILHCENTAVKDLKPLAGVPLSILHCQNTAVKDLSPLAGGPIVILKCQGTGADLKPLKGCNKLEDLNCDFILPRDKPTLKAIATLKTLNGADSSTLLK